MVCKLVYTIYNIQEGDSRGGWEAAKSVDFARVKRKLERYHVEREVSFSIASVGNFRPQIDIYHLNLVYATFLGTLFLHF